MQRHQVLASLHACPARESRKQREVASCSASPMLLQLRADLRITGLDEVQTSSGSVCDELRNWACRSQLDWS